MSSLRPIVENNMNPSASKSIAMRASAPEDIQQFIQHEARLLNESAFEDWLGLFTTDLCYWVPMRQGQTDGELEASLFYDNHDILTNRVNRLRHPKMWSQQPASTMLRIVSNITLDENFKTNSVVHSQFIAIEHRNEQRIFGGTYEHTLREVNSVTKIARKVIRLVNCEATLHNLALPF